MPIIPEVIEGLDRIRTIHKQKNDDYAEAGQEFFNFDVQEDIMNLFEGSRDKVFSSLVALKIARLAQTLKKSEVNNESIDDSFIDLATYVLLWRADYARRQKARRISDARSKSA